MFLYFIVFISDVNFVLYSDTNLVIKKVLLENSAEISCLG